MKVAILSLFRDNSETYIEAYLRRVDEMRKWSGYDVRVYAVEGDSQIPTHQWLRNYADPDTLVVIKHNTGKPHYGSVVLPERLECLAETANAGMDLIADQKWANYVMFLDSDLYPPRDLLKSLVETSKALEFPKNAVAPLVMAGEAFYDIWAFRKLDGEHFSPFVDWLKEKPEVFEVESAGGALLFGAEAAYQGALLGSQAIVSLCRNIRSLGFKIYVDRTITVYHPVPGGPQGWETNFMAFHSPLPMRVSGSNPRQG